MNVVIIYDTSKSNYECFKCNLLFFTTSCFKYGWSVRVVVVDVDYLSLVYITKIRLNVYLLVLIKFEAKINYLKICYHRNMLLLRKNDYPD